MVELLCRVLLPLSALLGVPLCRHQLPGVWPSLKEPAIRKVVDGMSTDGVPMSRICAGSASSWNTGPASVINARNQPLRVLRSMAFLPLVPMSLQKLMLSPFVVFCTVVAREV